MTNVDFNVESTVEPIMSDVLDNICEDEEKDLYKHNIQRTCVNLQSVQVWSNKKECVKY